MPLIDGFDRDRGWLNPTLHVATLDEFEDLFVTQAPNAERRQTLYSGLRGWIESLQLVVPIQRAWVDGGFITHKTQIPSDIDVVAFVKPSDLNDEIEARLEPLRTRRIDGTLVKPMGGRVDAYVVEANIENKVYWAKKWTDVRNPETGDTWEGAIKGFVEVRP